MLKDHQLSIPSCAGSRACINRGATERKIGVKLRRTTAIRMEVARALLGATKVPPADAVEKSG